MSDKFGTYITKLMTTVIDTEQDDFVSDLAFNELKRLNVNIEEFLRKHHVDESDKIEKTIKKQLLQEEQKDG
jgi:hypothetical protein